MEKRIGGRDFFGARSQLLNPYVRAMDCAMLAPKLAISIFPWFPIPGQLHKVAASDSRWIGVAMKLAGLIFAVQGIFSTAGLVWGFIVMLKAPPIDREEEERASMRSMSWPMDT